MNHLAIIHLVMAIKMENEKLPHWQEEWRCDSFAWKEATWQGLEKNKICGLLPYLIKPSHCTARGRGRQRLYSGFRKPSNTPSDPFLSFPMASQWKSQRASTLPQMGTWFCQSGDAESGKKSVACHSGEKSKRETGSLLQGWDRVPGSANDGTGEQLVGWS